MTMDRKKQSEIHGLGFRDICLAFLIVAAGVLILRFVQTQGEPPDKAKALLASCASQQSRLYQMMQVYDVEPPPAWTVADWFQAARKDRQASSPPLPEEELFCRQTGLPYLVFPVPASVLFTAPDPPVPVLMCPPGAHGEYGSNILCSDGTVRVLTVEDANKLVAERSPLPLKIPLGPAPGPD